MRIVTYLTHVEIRRVSEGVRQKDGQPYVVLKCEDMEANSFEITCNDKELFGSLYQLKKGDVCDLKCTIMATDRYQFVALEGAPELVED